MFYRWETSRAADCLQNLLGPDFKGTLQCDGFSAYRACADRRNGIELSGCWAHVRRKFHDALDHTPGRAGWVMRQIQHLYRIESCLREMKAGPKIAAIASVVETCRRLEIPLRAYLTGILPKFGDWPAHRVSELPPLASKSVKTANLP